MAEIEVGTASVKVQADMSEFAESAAEGVQGATGGLDSKLKGWGSTIGLVAGSAFALSFGKKGLTAAAELDKVTSRLQLGLEAVGGTAAKSLDPILEWARDFSLETGIAETSIVDMSSRLVSMGTAFFQAVGPQADEMLQLLVEDINDMASATGQTSARLMRSLGPALLNAPQKAIPILEKYGGISEETSKKVLQLAEAGDTTQASILLLNTIEEKWGGTTAEIADPLTKLKNTVTLLQTEVGKLLLPIANVMANFAKWALQNKALVGTIVGGAGLLYAINKVMSVMDTISKSKIVTFFVGMGESFQNAGAGALDVAANLGQVTQTATAVGEAVEGTGVALETVASAATITSGTIDGVTTASHLLTAASKSVTVATGAENAVTLLGVSIDEASMLAENELAVAKARATLAAEAEAAAMAGDTAAKTANAVATSRLALLGKGLLATFVKFGPWAIGAAVLFAGVTTVMREEREEAARLQKQIEDLSEAYASGKIDLQGVKDTLRETIPRRPTDDIYPQAPGIDPYEAELSRIRELTIAKQKAAYAAALQVEAERKLWQSSFKLAGEFVDAQTTKIGLLATATGKSFDEMDSSVRLALTHIRVSFRNGNKDLEGWKEFVGSTLDSARQEFAAFRESAAESINFVSSEFSGIAEQFHGDSSKIASALQDTFSDQRGFYADLKTILKDGTTGAKLLVDQLLAMGPAGAEAAHSIATGGKAARSEIEGVLRKSQEFADEAAGTLQRKMLGTLQDVKNLLTDIFGALAEKWDLPGIDTGKAKGALKNLQNAHESAREAAADHEQRIRTLHGEIDDLPNNTKVRVTTTVDDGALDGMRNKMVGMGFRMSSGGEWLASGKMRVTVTGTDSPPLPDEQIHTLIEMPLKNLGFRFSGREWGLKAAMRFTVMGGSPMPAEQMHQRIELPLKELGFTKHGIEWFTDLYMRFHVEGERTGIGALQATVNSMARTITKLGDTVSQAIDDAKTKLQEAIEKKVGVEAARVAVDTARAGAAITRVFEGMVNKATNQLDKLISKFKDFKSAIRDGFSELKDLPGALITGITDYQDALEQYQQDLLDYQQAMASYTGQGAAPIAPTAPGALNFAQIIQDQVAQAQELAKALTDAAAAGLSKGLLAQFASQGAEAIPALNELLANPELIAQLNEASRQINQAAGQTADALGEKFFAKAIRHATNRLDQLADALVRFIARLQRMLGDVSAGIQAQLDAIRQQAQQVAGGVTGGGGGGGGGGTGYDPDTHMPTGVPPAPPWEPTWKPTWEPDWEPTWHPPNRQPVTVNVNGWVGNDQDIANRVRDELLRVQSNNRTTGIR